MDDVTGVPGMVRTDVRGQHAEPAEQPPVTDLESSDERLFFQPLCSREGQPLGAGDEASASTMATSLPASGRETPPGCSQLAQRGSGGGMPVGLVHEISRPLAAAVNYLNAARRLIEQAKDPEEPATSSLPSEYLWQARKQMVRAGEILRRARVSPSPDMAGRSLQNLGRIIEDVISLGVLDARNPDLQLLMDVSTEAHFVLADSVVVRHVITGLLQNAAMALQGQLSCEILVTARACAQSNEVEVAIICTGSGPPALDGAEIVLPALSASQAPSEAGPSFAACQAIIRAHGGRVWTENRNRVATFRFTLPMGARAAA